MESVRNHSRVKTVRTVTIVEKKSWKFTVRSYVRGYKAIVFFLRKPNVLWRSRSRRRRVPCVSSLWLMPIWLQQDDVPVAYPSLLAHRLLHHLSHPLFTLLTPAESPDSTDLLSNFECLRSDLPSDVFMVTLRSLEDKQRPRPSGDALLVLHREGYDCNFDCKCLERTSRGQVSYWWLVLWELFVEQRNFRLSVTEPYQTNRFHCSLQYVTIKWTTRRCLAREVVSSTPAWPTLRVFK